MTPHRRSTGHSSVPLDLSKQSIWSLRHPPMRTATRKCQKSFGFKSPCSAEETDHRPNLAFATRKIKLLITALFEAVINNAFEPNYPYPDRHSTSVINTNLTRQKLSPKASPLSRAKQSDIEMISAVRTAARLQQSQGASKSLAPDFSVTPGIPSTFCPLPLPCVRGTVKKYRARRRA